MYSATLLIYVFYITYIESKWRIFILILILSISWTLVIGRLVLLVKLTLALLLISKMRTLVVGKALKAKRTNRWFIPYNTASNNYKNERKAARAKDRARTQQLSDAGRARRTLWGLFVYDFSGRIEFLLWFFILLNIVKIMPMNIKLMSI